MRWLFRLLRWSRDVRAVVHGHVARRVYNRSVSAATGRVRRKLWRR